MTERSAADTGPDDTELDVRGLPKPQRHPVIFARFEALAVGESFTLVNSHDPKHLHDEFEREHPGAYAWAYLDGGEDGLWRIRITRRTAADAPRVLADTTSLLDAPATADQEGAIWRIDVAQRHLDANVIRLSPDGRIDSHLGPDLDVLIHVLQGSGEIITAVGTLPIAVGALVWLPRRSQRTIAAGSQGLVYLSVHPRRPGLSIMPSSHTTGR